MSNNIIVPQELLCYSMLCIGLPDISENDEIGNEDIGGLMVDLTKYFPNCVTFIPKKINKNLSKEFPGGVVYFGNAGIVDIDEFVKKYNALVISAFSVEIEDIPEGINNPLALLAIEFGTKLTKEQTLKYVSKLTPELMVYLSTLGICLDAPTVIQHYADGDLNSHNIKTLLHFAVLLIKHDIVQKCGYDNDIVTICSNVNLFGYYINEFGEHLQEILYCYIDECDIKYVKEHIEIVYNF